MEGEGGPVGVMEGVSAAVGDVDRELLRVAVTLTLPVGEELAVGDDDGVKLDVAVFVTPAGRLAVGLGVAVTVPLGVIDALGVTLRV